jgi:tryptophan synthase alpha subunit
LNGDRVRSAFREGKTALVPYLTGGYPTLEGAREVGEAYLEVGTDVLEIGVPFSDPLADGPTIQETTTRALANGADLDYCLDLASVFSGRVPAVFLLYYNVIFARGVEQFLQEVAEAGVSGLVIPDLPVDEAGRFAELASGAGVAFCPLDGAARLACRRDGDRVRVLRLCGRGYGGARHPATGCHRASEACAREDRCAGGPWLRDRFGPGCRRGRRGGRWDYHREQAHAARRGRWGGASRRVAARGA